MKKNIFLTLALSLTFAGTAWGQSSTEPFTASITNTPITYDGEAHSPSITANCAYGHSFAAVTNAGTYQVTVNNQCPTHSVGTGTLTHTGTDVTLDFVIDPHNIADAAFVTTVNANDMKWTGNTLTPVQGDGNGTYQLKATIGGSKTDLVLNTDYTFYTIPSEVKNAGEYTIVFVGKGNYNGTVTTTFNVKKDLSEPAVINNVMLYDIPVQIIPFEDKLTALNMTISDKESHETLYEDVDYTLKYYQNDGTTEITDFKTNGLDYSTAGVENKYVVEVTGKGTKYNGWIKHEFWAVKEYQLTGENVSLHITEPGYSIVQTSPTGAVVKGKMMVGDKTEQAIAEAIKTLKIPATKNVNAGTKDITFDIVGIENNALKDFSTLRYLDITDMTDFTPSSLSRTATNTPFYGLPKQTLVYLDGTTVEGENYIYKYSTNDFRCDVYKIYDDPNGNQKGFSDEKAAKWDITIPISFKANTVKNTRNLIATANNKQQGYTTCLPYAMPIPESFKAYKFIASATNKNVGFNEVTGTIEAMTPYVIIPSASGQLLKATDVTVVKTYDATTHDYVPTTDPAHAAASGQAYYSLKGTMQYLSGATDMYIMQKDNVWNEITAASDYPDPCVLPMRAYILDEGTTAAARLFSVFNNADGSTTVIKGLKLDADATGDIYDLQGRKVTAPQRGGLYIINGKKAVMK